MSEYQNTSIRNNFLAVLGRKRLYIYIYICQNYAKILVQCYPCVPLTPVIPRFVNHDVDILALTMLITYAE